MGCWAAPSKDSEIAKLEEIMAKPLSASAAEDALYHVLGDDDLFDNLISARQVDPGSDVRSLVALRLGEMLYLIPEDGWNLVPSGRERLERIVDAAARQMASNDIIVRIGRCLDPQAAVMNVAAVLGIDDAVGLEAMGSVVPGAFAVLSENGAAFHVNAVDGSVTEIPAECRDRYEEKLNEKFSLDGAVGIRGW